MKIFIGNLASSVNLNDLRKLFADYGTVIEADVAKDESTGKPLGYGNVYLVPDRAARDAILELHLAPVKGRPIAVRECFFRAAGERRVNKVTWKSRDRRRHTERRKEPEDQQLHG